VNLHSRHRGAQGTDTPRRGTRCGHPPSRVERTGPGRASGGARGLRRPSAAEGAVARMDRADVFLPPGDDEGVHLFRQIEQPCSGLPIFVYCVTRLLQALQPGGQADRRRRTWVGQFPEPAVPVGGAPGPESPRPSADSAGRITPPSDCDSGPAIAKEAASPGRIPRDRRGQMRLRRAVSGDAVSGVSTSASRDASTRASVGASRSRGSSRCIAVVSRQGNASAAQSHGRVTLASPRQLMRTHDTRPQGIGPGCCGR
jgi:hypothetical protein